MKYVLILMTGLLCIPAAAMSQDTPPELPAGLEQPGWYGSLGPGMALMNTVEAYGFEYSFKPGFSLSGALGYDTGRFRLETEITYQENRFDELAAPVVVVPGFGSFGGTGDIDGTASLFRVMVNGWFNAFNVKTSRIYIGGGIGNCRTEYEITSGLGDSDSDSAMAYQLGIMTSMPLSEKASLGISYRYLITEYEPGDADIGTQVIGFQFSRKF